MLFRSTLYRKLGYRTSAYTEGWALYAEQFAVEIGMTKDLYDELGVLQSEMFRANRLVVDTGIHFKKWSREQAMDYMKKTTGMSDTQVRVEIERYIVWPGQALSYKIGMLKILELREKAKEKMGQNRRSLLLRLVVALSSVLLVAYFALPNHDWRFLETSFLNILKKIADENRPEPPDLVIESVDLRKIGDPSDGSNFYKYYATVVIKIGRAHV